MRHRNVFWRSAVIVLTAAGYLISGGAVFAADEYLGSEVCKSCHFKQYKTASKTKHAFAFDELKGEERKDPKCVKCHTTGFGRPGGFKDIESTPDLAGVQCEVCHGAGSAHSERVKAAKAAGGEITEDPGVRMASGNVCIGCHNPHLNHKRMKKFLKVIKEMDPPSPGIAENNDTLPYVGYKACVECHEEEVETWKNMKHAGAFDTLEEKYLSNPKCVACHSTGFGKKGGFVDIGSTPEMKHVQCEMCHGPGSRHVAEGRDQRTPYNNVRNVCTDCHNPHISHVDKH